MRFWLILLAFTGAWAVAQTPPAPKTQSQANLCAVLYEAGRYETALKSCEKAIKENPTPEAYNLLARVQAELSLFTASIDNYKAAIKLNSTFVQAYVGLSQVYVRQYLLSDNRETAKPLLDQALSVLKEAERANAKYAPIFATKGLILAYQGKTDQAIESMNKSLSLKDDPVVRASLADIYARQGKMDEALKNYDEAVKAAPKNSGLRIKYGSLLLLKGDVDGAISHLDEAVVLSPGSAEAWLRRGDAYYEKKDWKQSGVSYEQTVALAPVRFPDAYWGLGLVYIELGDYKKAKFNLTKAVALEDNNPVFRYWLGRANELAGDKAGAKTQCEIALKLRPQYKEAQDCIDRVKQAP